MEPVQPDVEELKGQRQRVEAILVGKLNLADFQNAVPMLRELSLVNDTNDAAKELELHVESVPAFLKPKVWRVDAVAAGDSYRITDLDVQLDGAFFTRLTEAETATVTFSLRRRDNAIPELARLERTVELLPRNQWGGISHMPDLVAAFVQPKAISLRCTAIPSTFINLLGPVPVTQGQVVKSALLSAPRGDGVTRVDPFGK